MADTEKETTEKITDFPGRLIPPLAYNAFHIIVQKNNTRFTLGESLYSDIPTHYSSTFLLPTEVATDMAKSILRLAVRQGFLPVENLKTELAELEAELTLG